MWTPSASPNCCPVSVSGCGAAVRMRCGSAGEVRSVGLGLFDCALSDAVSMSVPGALVRQRALVGEEVAQGLGDAVGVVVVVGGQVTQAGQFDPLGVRDGRVQGVQGVFEVGCAPAAAKEQDVGAATPPARSGRPAAAARRRRSCIRPGRSAPIAGWGWRRPANRWGAWDHSPVGAVISASDGAMIELFSGRC